MSGVSLLASLLHDRELRDALGPVWPQLIAYLWLVALWVYYVPRAVTRSRPGPPDAEARQRGAALEAVLHEAEAEHRRGEGRPAPVDRPVRGFRTAGRGPRGLARPLAALRGLS